MPERTFRVIIEKDDSTGIYTAQCVEFPMAISQGRTEDEAKRNIKEAIELVLEYLQDKAKNKYGNKKIIEVAV
jgi:predicted RNase H-like HicB family nuclease